MDMKGRFVRESAFLPDNIDRWSNLDLNNWPNIVPACCQCHIDVTQLMKNRIGRKIGDSFVYCTVKMR